LKFKKMLATVVLTVFTLSLAVGCGSKPVAEPEKKAEKKEAPFKVAGLMPGPINDGGWNASCYEGLLKCKDKLGAEMAYSESVPQSDFEETFRGYASQGYNVIIGHGFQFADAAKKVALEFPKTIFLITDANVVAEPNVGSYSVLAKEAGFLGGVVAASISKSNTVAIVGGKNIPPVTNTVKGFDAGAKYINPKITVKSTITESFEDAARAKEQTKVFIEQGADVVMHNADQAGLGVFEACKEKQVLAIGVTKDQTSLAPDVILTSAFRNIPEGILYIVGEVKSGNYKAQYSPLGVKQDVVGLIWNDALKGKVNAEQMAKINSVMDELKAGKIDVDKLAP
jgi:basic membrane protein A